MTSTRFRSWLTAAAALTLTTSLAHAGGGLTQIDSPGGGWSAGIDQFGQVERLNTPDQPTLDNVFETLVYVADTSNNQLSRRVETAFVVTQQSFTSSSSFTRLEDAAAQLSVEIENIMIDGPNGGVLVKIRCENKGTKPINCKVLYYCDFDIGGDFDDDEALAEIDGFDDCSYIQQGDDGDIAINPLWFGGCGPYESCSIQTFFALRASLDGGIAELDGVDSTTPGPADHTCALSGDKTQLLPGESTEVRFGIGAPEFAGCEDPPKNPCPADLNGDNVVNAADLAVLLGAWGPNPGSIADLNGDNIVNAADLATLLGAWGPCPVPPVVPCPGDPFSTCSVFGDPKLESFMQIGSPFIQPIPADFFSPGSDPFVGNITLMGVPIDPDNLGMADTIIRRTGPVNFPGAGFPRPSDPVPVEIVELQLTALDPITVTHNGGLNPEEWVIGMGLSDNQQQGVLGAVLEDPNGGAMGADLPVKPVLVFARQSDLVDLENGSITPEQVDLRILDWDNEGLPPVQMGWAQPFPFSTQPPIDGGFFCEDELPNDFPFFPGVPPGGCVACGDGGCGLPPFVSLPDGGASLHQFLGAPPPQPTDLCAYSLTGVVMGACAGPCEALPNVIVRGFCPGPCPPRIVVVVKCKGGYCIAYYKSDGCS